MSFFVDDTAFDSYYSVSATKYAGVAGIDAATLFALAKGVTMQESRFDPGAYRAEPQINDASRGLMQLLAGTAQAIGYTGPIGDDSSHTGGLYDPQTNIDYGVRLLAENIRTAGGNLPIAISAYNAGFSAQRPGDAKRDASGNILNQPYVDAVTNYFNGYLAQAAPSDGTQASTIDLAALAAALPWWGWVLGALGIGAAAGLFRGHRP